MPTKTELIAFSERLNEALDDINVPPKGFGRQNVVANLFGVSQKGARRWLEAEALPDTGRIPVIAHKLKVSVEWLMSGIGKNKTENLSELWPKIPVLDWKYISLKPILPENIQEEITLTDCKASDKTFAVRMKGSSMEPVFPEGTLLIIDPNKELINRNYVLVLLRSEKEVIFKQLLLDGDKKFIKSLSSDFVGIRPQLLEPDDKIIGSLVQARMNY